MAIVIFANGDLVETEWAEKHVKEANYVIAADGGLKHLRRMGSWPDLIIGDLDSAEAEEFQGRGDVSIIRKPADKDETDLELALIHATERFDDEVLVFGAMGGRIDQTLANAMLLAHPLLRFKKITLLEHGQKAWLLRPIDTISGQTGDVVSLIPLDTDVNVEATTGLRWPLNNESLILGASRGVSNELVDNKAEIKLYEGLLLCVHTERGWQNRP